LRNFSITFNIITKNYVPPGFSGGQSTSAFIGYLRVRDILQQDRSMADPLRNNLSMETHKLLPCKVSEKAKTPTPFQKTPHIFYFSFALKVHNSDMYSNRTATKTFFEISYPSL